jgi:hypothetical protein
VNLLAAGFKLKKGAKKHNQFMAFCVILRLGIVYAGFSLKMFYFSGVVKAFLFYPRRLTIDSIAYFAVLDKRKAKP